MVAPLPIPNITGGPSGPALSGGDPAFNGRNFIDIKPVNVNIGEIIKNFTGPPENGGLGLDVRSRYFGAGLSAGNGGVQASVGSRNVVGLLVIVAIGAAVIWGVQRFGR